MDLNLVKTGTLTVLLEISTDELNTVTLPILREKVAEYMKLPKEELLGKEVKRIILETFQEFLLSKNNEKSDYEIVENELKETKEEINNNPNPKLKKNTKKIEIVSEKSVKKKKSTNNTETKGDNKASTKTTDTDNQLTCKSSAKSLQIEKLKSYVFKCGVRKVWKKELEGLNENQCISKIQGILRELGIEGKPSLVQCKAIKARREFEAELKEIDTSNIIEGKRRNRGGNEIEINNKRKLVISDEDEEEENFFNDQCENENSVTVDLKNIGDSESD